MKIRTFFEMKTFLFICFCLVFSSDSEEIRDERRFFGPHFPFQRNKVFVSPKHLLMPPQSRYPGAGPGRLLPRLPYSLLFFAARNFSADKTKLTSAQRNDLMQ